MWRNYYDNQIAVSGGQVFIRSGEQEPVYLLPAGGDLREGIELLRAYAGSKGEPLQLFGADEAQRERIERWFPGLFLWEPSINDFDYLYNADDLAELAGRKYHGKRNHIAAFESSYDWTYEPIDDHNAAEVDDMVREWCRERGNCSDPGLKNERCAVSEAMRNRQALSLRGGLLRVEGKVVAMTFGSPINADVFDVHVEKALPAYNGAYAMINNQFVKREIQGCWKLVNRENDLGIEGLRRAKKSYHPARVLEKYLAIENR